MYYLLSLLLFVILYYVFMKVLGSLVKGCFTALLFVFIAYAVVIMVKSTKQPVDVFGIYQVDNFNIKKL